MSVAVTWSPCLAAGCPMALRALSQTYVSLRSELDSFLSCSLTVLIQLDQGALDLDNAGSGVDSNLDSLDLDFSGCLKGQIALRFDQSIPLHVDRQRVGGAFQRNFVAVLVLNRYASRPVGIIQRDDVPGAGTDDALGYSPSHHRFAVLLWWGILSVPESAQNVGVL